MLEKYGQTIIVLLSILSTTLGSCMWMNGKFNDIEKDILTIKNVLILKGIMPAEMAKTKEVK